ncbi:protein NRT1/ PTR FAMILY 5.4-like [Arachis stenosperma]|uniref:protein NRT1/ PTR FAMILY 5.4-like n=1 Tax=Arachis stenosperma TaxID=217475 RepID=UPI0025AD5EEF|nr:protein NRT1/ PTR FAMILY 5.4-like [Arachis stenosperma]
MDDSKNTKTTKEGGWHAAIFITFVEFAESFAITGLRANLITYLTNELDESLSEATKNINTWNGVLLLFPLLGGFIADSYLGRFTTIILSSLICLLGMVLLTISVSLENHHEKLFFIALYIASVGDGGHRPCLQTFAADQFDDGTAEERDTKSSFFNWWFLTQILAAISAVFFLGYLQENVGWNKAMALQTIVWIISLSIFLVGIKRYKKQSPTGSPFTNIAQVFVAAFRKRHVKATLHHAHGVSEQHTDQYRFLDKAMMMDEDEVSSNVKDPWRLCTMDQVEEVKILLGLIPISLSCVMFAVVQCQLSTFFIKQATTMQRSIAPNFKIPAASLQGVVGIVILFCVPIYDRVFVPIARKFTGQRSGITFCQRIGAGLVLSVLNMVVSGFVEAKRIGVCNQHNLMDNPNAEVPISIWWLLPQYVIIGTSDALTVIGFQELYYDQMPEEMRSLGAAALSVVFGIGSFVNNGIIAVVVAISSRFGDKWLQNNLNKAHLHHLYWILAGLSAINLCVYVRIANVFVYKKVHMVQAVEGHHPFFLNENNQLRFPLYWLEVSPVDKYSLDDLDEVDEDDQLLFFLSEMVKSGSSVAYQKV